MDRFQCPICQQPLVPRQRSLCCQAGHSFDLARQGYVNLLPSHHRRSGAAGDSADMMAARTRFLDRGFYCGLADAISVVLQDQCAGDGIADLGCGEGYFTATALRDGEAVVYGLDISKPAILAATRRQPKLHLAVANVTRLPLQDASFDTVTVVMAPFPDGAVRVLRQGGHLLRVSPAPHHLAEVKPYFFAVARAHGRARLDCEGFAHRLAHRVTFEMCLDVDAIGNLLAMTPMRYRAKRSLANAGPIPDGITVTADFWIDLFKKL